MIRYHLGLIAAVIACGLATNTHAQTPPQFQVIVKVFNNPGKKIPETVIYDDGGSQRIFTANDTGRFQFSVPIPTAATTARVTIGDAEGQNAYNDTIVLAPQHGRNGRSVIIRLDHRITAKCSHNTLKLLEEGDPSVDRVLANYFAIRRIRYMNNCKRPEHQRRVLETWYRLSLRINRGEPVFAVDPNAERELTRQDPQLLNRIRNQELG